MRKLPFYVQTEPGVGPIPVAASAADRCKQGYFDTDDPRRGHRVARLQSCLCYTELLLGFRAFL